ncbi:hypothetical protein HU200_015026 [Digitaria exilis]|uniref:Late embryogenesis abundant protein LEA-2 subgroup domain-containing protein n=1 Tax=Digitaria exilis TaxID=1010633 RepID=A0A835F9U2_9POAL|nr:hypothetical protein HU200_015026 [Digitaria exilis]CAB3469296.1 unnamed protein product [Digitaria exilis]
MAALLGTEMSVKRVIMAAVAATLVVMAVVTIVSVVLSPAHVSFAVTDTYSQITTDGMLRLHLAIVAENTSERMAVMYRSILVDVSNSTGPHLVNSVSADVATRLMPLFQRPESVLTVATVSLMGGSMAQVFTRNLTSEFSVTITATARFKVGIAWTRLYDIRVTCEPVSFFFSDDGHSKGAAGQRVDCSAA